MRLVLYGYSFAVVIVLMKMDAVPAVLSRMNCIRVGLYIDRVDFEVSVLMRLIMY